MLKTKEEIENKLNKEYKKIGKITIRELHEENININDIKYINSIMNYISPLDIEEPIIVGKDYNGYYLIDGYHRLKSKLEKLEKEIKVIVLDSYSINRENDTLYDFLKSLIGEEIKFIDSNTLLCDNKLYQIEENEGCGGCSNGWSSIEVLPEFINKTIKINTIEDRYERKNEDEYELYINGIKIADIDTGYGNGFYGGDFKINLIN